MNIFTLIGAMVATIFGLVIYGLVGWCVYFYGVRQVEKIIIWGMKIELGKYGVIIGWPLIIAAVIIFSAASVIGQLYHTIKCKINKLRFRS